MSISIYLILLIVLLIFNLVFWVLVIWFRILFDCEIGKCCGSRPSEDSEASTGHRNLGYVDTEDSWFSRPATIAERMETPPSYEEAVKFEQFGFQISPSVLTSSNLPSASASSERSDAHTSHTQSTHVTSTERATPLLPQSPPRVPEVVRSRSSTGASSSILTPIREEDVDEMPVSVVIDCIGVQASRLLENCDTKVEITGAISGQSKC